MSRISSIVSTLSNFIKSNWVKILIVIIAIGAGYSYFANKANNNKVSTIFPIRKDISEIVELSGPVEPVSNADLSFEKSGVISSVKVKVGDRVVAGQVLATISGADANASVLEAEAGVASAQATLDQLKSGATESELNVKYQNLESAKQDLQNAESQIEDTTRNSENIITDIIEYKLSNIFYKDGANYKMNFVSCDQSSQNQIEITRKTFDNINITNLETASSNASNLNDFLGKINTLLTLPCSISDSSLDSKRGTISSAKTALSPVFSDISAKRTGVQNAKNSVAKAQKDLELSQAGTDQNRIKSQEAVVGQAYARLQSARAQASKNVLTAPFSGVVTEVNIETGELSSVAKSSISIISDNNFQVKVKISEVDISKMKIGNTATIVLDAYPNVDFPAIISRIDPSATIEGGVPRYGAVLSFVAKDDRIKSGMTANAKVVTHTSENALTIPASYITIKNGGGIVKVMGATTTLDTIVQVGIRGNDGNVEIVSGITESDKLVEVAENSTVVR